MTTFEVISAIGILCGQNDGCQAYYAKCIQCTRDILKCTISRAQENPCTGEGGFEMSGCVLKMGCDFYKVKK